MEIKTMAFKNVAIHDNTTLDYPTAWELQKEVGDKLTHDPLCSSRPEYGMLCDCGALESEWRCRMSEEIKAQA